MYVILIGIRKNFIHELFGRHIVLLGLRRKSSLVKRRGLHNLLDPAARACIEIPML